MIVLYRLSGLNIVNVFIWSLQPNVYALRTAANVYSSWGLTKNPSLLVIIINYRWVSLNVLCRHQLLFQRIHALWVLDFVKIGSAKNTCIMLMVKLQGNYWCGVSHHIPSHSVFLFVFFFYSRFNIPRWLLLTHSTRNWRSTWIKLVLTLISTSGMNRWHLGLLIHMIHYPILLGSQMLKPNLPHA